MSTAMNIGSGHVKEWPMLIGGSKVSAASGERFDVLNPATGEPFCTVPKGGAEDIDRAVTAAKEGLAKWSAMSASQRANILNKVAEILQARMDELVAVEVTQTGRPLREMRAQMGRLPEWYTYFAAIARTYEDRVHPFGGDHLNYTRRLPIGVVGLVTPWNHPLLILTKKLAPALAAGNAVVVKPSEIAPITPIMLGDILAEAGLPDGVYNVVTGFGADAGAALSKHEGISKLDLTGGTETGRRVAALAGERLIAFAGELGGKASMVVFDDVPVETAAAATLFASFVAAGQTCVQGARLLVHESIHDQVIDRLVARAEALRVGDPADEATQMGPVVSDRQLETVEKYVQIGKDEGARLVTGGQRLSIPGQDGGYFYAPTIFADVSNEMRVAQEEIFGPVVCVMKFSTEEEAIALANGTDFGLAASVWSGNLSKARRVAERIEAGIVWINDHHRIDPSSPWGGFKASGLGKENGIVCYEGYTKMQSIVMNTSEEHFDWFTDDGKPKRYS